MAGLVTPRHARAPQPLNSCDGTRMPDVVISNEDTVRKIRMNRPGKKNALTLAMYEAMAAAIEDASSAAGVRCVLIAGAPDVFCAGNDLNDFVTMAKSGGLGAPIIRFLH